MNHNCYLCESVAPLSANSSERLIFWERVKDESEPQATSACGRAFMLLHGGFQLSGSSFSPLTPRSVMSFTTFFFALARDVAKSLGLGGVWSDFFETTSTWCFLVWINSQSWLGCRPNQSSFLPCSQRGWWGARP